MNMSYAFRVVVAVSTCSSMLVPAERMGE